MHSDLLAPKRHNGRIPLDRVQYSMYPNVLARNQPSLMIAVPPIDSAQTSLPLKFDVFASDIRRPNRVPCKLTAVSEKYINIICLHPGAIGPKIALESHISGVF